MTNRRFSVKFCRKALKEYNALDNAIIGEVNEALESLEERADEVGKVLGKKRSIDLTLSREKKLRSSGIRIIYIVSKETREVEVLQITHVLPIVEILLVSFKQSDQDLYKEAAQRLQVFRKHGVQEIEDESLYWELDIVEDEKDELIDLNMPSMIDQIFDENFDNLDESFKNAILGFYFEGNVAAAYDIWKIANGID